MMERRRIPMLALALVIHAAVALGAVVSPSTVSAHEFALESVASSFVKIDPHEAHLVIRIPLHAVKTVAFPMKGREIDLAKAEPAIQQAVADLGRALTIWEDGLPLVPSGSMGRLSLPSDRSFERYDDAVAHVARSVASGTTIYFEQGYLDAHLTYPIGSPGSPFMIRTALAPELRDYLKLTIRYIPLGEDGRAMVITSRSGKVSLNPTWYQAGRGFTMLGVAHILSGVDHLLFLFCLVIPLRGLRQILPIVTAFTVAHSVTLLGSAYQLTPSGLWFQPFVETVIAASIVYMALENILGADLRRRWLVTGAFGLVHGFGFSYGLKENLQFAGRHLLVSLLSFNVGIEIGQLLVLAVTLPVLGVLFRYVFAGRVGMVVVSAVVAHIAWHWMLERGELLWRAPWPTLDASGLATLARWLAASLVAVGAVSLFARRLRFGLSLLKSRPAR